jgi:hypothetical protein
MSLSQNWKFWFSGSISFKHWLSYQRETIC